MGGFRERPFVLVIDPEEAWVRQLESAYPEFRFRWFEDGELGLRAVQRYGVGYRRELGGEGASSSALSLVILSADLPKLKGFYILQKIREWLPELPVVLGSIYPDLCPLALQKGAIAFFQKPFSISQFRDVFSVPVHHVKEG
jgi:DNA-binding response OmpR family regulator